MSLTTEIKIWKKGWEIRRASGASLHDTFKWVDMFIVDHGTKPIDTWMVGTMSNVFKQPEFIIEYFVDVVKDIRFAKQQKQFGNGKETCEHQTN